MANIDITNRRGDIVVQVADNQINEPAPAGVTSINVVGRNVLDYGDEIGNNLHWIMESFANITAPEGQVDGQLWWDISNSLNPVLRVYSDVISSWITVTKIKDDTAPELSTTLDASGNKIINLLNPVNPQDASTKGYVDNEIASSIGAAADTIISLTDTPSTFLGQANKILKVNASQDSVIFDNVNFLELTDTPGLFLGAANQVVRVNSSANALEFKLLALTDLISTGPLNMGGFRIEALGNPNTSDDAMSLGFADDRYLRDTSGNTNGIPVRISSTGETISRSISAGAGILVSNGSGVSGNPTISHANTSSQGSVNNSGSVVIQDITLDTYGHITGIASTSLTIPTTGFNDDRYLRDTVSNTNGIVVRTSSTGETRARSIAAGTGITVSNGDGVNGNPVISHSNTSSQGSVNNSGNTMIQDIILDGFGHITSIASATVSTGIASALLAFDKSSKGHAIIDGGALGNLIIQWGQQTGMPKDANTTITWDITFPNAVFQAFDSFSSFDQNQDEMHGGFTSISRFNGTYRTSRGPASVRWLAIGW